MLAVIVHRIYLYFSEVSPNINLSCKHTKIIKTKKSNISIMLLSYRPYSYFTSFSTVYKLINRHLN